MNTDNQISQPVDRQTRDILDIINSNAPKSHAKPPRANSNFHIVLNTNISHYELRMKDFDYKVALIGQLRTSIDHFKNNMHKFVKQGNPPLKDFSANVEIGNEKKFLHIDGMIRFNGYCLLDTGKITKYFNESLASYTKGCYFHCQYIHDSLDYAQQYSKKDQAPLV